MTDIILLIIFGILQAGDGWTTWEALRKPGNYEANKAVKWIMARIGVIPALILLKGGITVLMGAAVYYAPSIYLTVALAGLCCLYAWIVFNNYKLIKGI
jgi:hypothetical protein